MADDTLFPAATVILLRDAPAFEALMVTRHADIGFAGGALVFPGGRIDPGDAAGRWRARADGLSADDTLASAQVAAIREAFEETGILLARTHAGADAAPEVVEALQPMRAAVEADDAAFLGVVADAGLRLACDRLVLFARWVAPPGLSKRFDTWFFAAPAPAGQAVAPDGGEATEALWIAPEAALAARASGARKVIFPTARNLELLALSRSVAEVAAFARVRTIRPVCPSMVERDGARLLTIPDDLGYPVTEEVLASAMRG